MTNTWSIPIAALAEKIGADIELVARKATLDVFSSVVQKSPVDTGRFKSNWNVSFSAPDASVTASVNQARAVQQVALASSLPIGGVTYISNGLPYSLRLEDGYSKKAPVGMVKLSAQEFSDYVARAIAAT